MPTPFATADDVADRWRPLTDTEQRLAGTLADDASRRVRNRWPTIDARISAGSLDEGDVRMVVAGMVKRALINTAMEGVTQGTDTAGPFSQSRTYANPSGNLYFTADDLSLLSPSGGTRVRSVRLTIAGDT